MLMSKVKKLKTDYSKIQEDWLKLKDVFIERVNFLIPRARWQESCEGISIDELQTQASSLSDFGVRLGADMGHIFEHALGYALKKLNLNGKQYNSSEGDFIWHNLIAEMKSSPRNDWAGATHSASKSLHYILIKYELNRTKVIKEGEDYLKSLSVILTDIDKEMWYGTHKSNSSFTKLEIPIEHPLIMLMGGRRPKKKYLEFINEGVDSPLGI
jgi:hypothetical protein